MLVMVVLIIRLVQFSPVHASDENFPAAKVSRSTVSLASFLVSLFSFYSYHTGLCNRGSMVPDHY